MWTIDAQCPQCKEKAGCKNRPELIKTLSGLTNRLNTAPELAEGPGDGRIIVSCADFSVA